MPRRGDYYEVKLKAPHLGWGNYRYTDTRPIIYGEGYIKIPSRVANSLRIYNSNLQGDMLGVNIFNCRSTDGLYSGQLKAQGCSRAGDVCAKQFAEIGHLQGIGTWYRNCQAKIDDYVRVEWISETDIEITLMKNQRFYF